MSETMIENLQKNTGKSLEEWIAIVKATKIEKHGQIVKHLKEVHGFTHGFANLVAHKAKESDAGSHADADLIQAQYAGDKAQFLPIYEALLAKIKAFGGDVEIAPKKAYVSVRRKKQFAIIQPSTKTRMDIGLNFKEKATTKRLEASGSFNAMCSHRVRLTSIEDVNDELIGWIKEAYEQAG